MDGRSVQRSIAKGWRAIDDVGLGASFARPVSLPVSEEFRNISLAPGVRYEEIYRKGMELVHYNIMLTDYSYFQFSWFGKENVRYVYYPNPFAKDRSTLVDHERLRAPARATRQRSSLLRRSGPKSAPVRAPCSSAAATL